MLKAKLLERDMKQKEKTKADQYADLPDNSWGNQIRNYVLNPYQLAKDSRTGYERKDIENVLDGDIDGYDFRLLYFN